MDPIHEKFKLRGLILPNQSKNYKIYTYNDIAEKEISKVVEKAMEIFGGVSVEDCKKLLYDFNWDCNTLFDNFNELNIFSSFPNVSEKAIILARGAGEFKLDFSNDHVNRKIDNLYICRGHRNELSLEWEFKKYSHVMTRWKNEHGSRKPVPVCTLPAPFGANHNSDSDRPFTCRHKVSFEEASAFLEVAGHLIHPGIPVCSDCAEYLKSLIPNNSDAQQPSSNNDFDDVNMGSADETGSNKDVDMSDARAAKVKAIAALRNYSEASQTTKAAELSSEIADVVRKLGQLTGISVPTERKPFEDLKDDTKQRKVQILQSFQEVIARQLAPDNPTSLIVLANSKNQQSNESTGEKRLKNLMSMIKSQYYVAESDRERIAVLSQIALEIPLEELKKVIPGLTKYQWKTARRQAREHLEVWKPKVEKQIRVKYDRASIDVFLEFITSSAVMAGLPFGTKVGKLPDGRRFDIPSTLRKQDDAEIIRMFEHYVKEKELHVKISHTVMRNILKVCPAIRMKAMECVDYYEATGKTAFEKIANRMDKLSTMNLVDREWQKEVQQELQEAKLYLRTDYRLHIAEKSQVAEHCMNHSLSDNHNSEFRSSSCQTDNDFPHTHNAKCERCLVFPQTMKKIYEKIAELIEDEEKTKGDHEKLEEIKEEIEKYENDVLEWKKHVMRSAYSEKCRLQIIDELKEGDALITCDYSMKWIPRHYRETQKDFYGKKGLSWHISHVLAKKDGKLVQHTVVHNLGFEEQDSNAVAAIVTDVLKKCKSWGINAVVLRSDNAGYYRNAALISSIPNISEKTGVIVKAYTFSEPQAGKGPSDREGARIKWRMICALNNQYNITTSEEMFLAMTYGQKRLGGLTVVTATVSGDKKEASTSIPGISFLSHVEYSAEDKSFIFWKHYGIGEGKKIKFEKPALNNELLINSTTTETPLDNEYVFWRNTGSVAEKQKKKQKKGNAGAKQIVKDDDEEESSEEETTYKMFRCTEPNCIKKYVHYGNLCNHIESDKHEYKPLRKTLYDYALTKFGEHLDDLKERNLQLYARQTLQDCVSVNNATVSEGWALRTNAKNKRFSNDVHKFVEELLLDCLQKKKRFNPKDAAEAMENAKSANGRSRFRPSERLNESQMSGLAQRKLKKMEKMDHIDKQKLEHERALINDEMEADTGKGHETEKRIEDVEKMGEEDIQNDVDICQKYERIANGLFNLKCFEASFEYYLKALQNIIAENLYERKRILKLLVECLERFAKSEEDYSTLFKYYDEIYEISQSLNSSDIIEIKLNRAISLTKLDICSFEDKQKTLLDIKNVLNEDKLMVKYYTAFINMLKLSNGHEIEIIQMEEELKLYQNRVIDVTESSFARDASVDQYDELKIHEILKALEEKFATKEKIETMKKKMFKKDSYGFTELHKAVKSRKLDEIKFMIEHCGFKDVIDEADAGGKTPLFHAVMNGENQIAEYLIKCGASVDICTTDKGSKDPSGRTALMEAASLGNAALVRFLLDKGANPLLKDANEKMASFYLSNKLKLCNAALKKRPCPKIAIKEKEQLAKTLSEPEYEELKETQKFLKIAEERKEKQNQENVDKKEIIVESKSEVSEAFGARKRSTSEVLNDSKKTRKN